MGNVRSDFTGENALITGASKGLGRAIALHFAGAGCNIAATGRHEGDLQSLAKEVREMGVRCEIKPAELALEQDFAHWDHTTFASMQLFQP